MTTMVASTFMAIVAMSALLCASPSMASPSPQDFERVLQRVADKIHAKYNTSLALTLHRGSAPGDSVSVLPPNTSVVVAAGYTDAGLNMGTPTRAAQPHDLYVWGSITKMFTGPAVLQLVDSGAMALDDPITQHVDPLLQHINGTTLEDHFGPNISRIQVQHLLHMTSGLHDFDGEDYARDQFAHRLRDFSPIEIIGKYVEPKISHPPGAHQSYCSTNYVLLGLALANHYHKTGTTWSWESYDQRSVIPEALRKAFTETVFVNHGPCKDYTPVHGFMEGYSTASLVPQDVWNISCAGGWTAGNYVGSVTDVARYTYDLYNTQRPSIVSRSALRDMLNFTAPPYAPGEPAFKFYGMGTFNLDWSIGNGSTPAYGHVGDTYGYQSQTTYFPGGDFVLTVATNVETDSQAQPAEATCLAYHQVMALAQGTPPPQCTFYVPHRFIGTCNCSGSV